jgi:hypothetical protein
MNTPLVAGAVLLVMAGVILVKVWAQAETVVMCLVPPCAEVGWNKPWLGVACLLAVLGGVLIARGVFARRRSSQRPIDAD